MPIMRWFIEINAARMKHYFSFGAKKAMFPGNGVKLDLLSRLQPIQIYGPAYYHRHFVSHAVKKGELVLSANLIVVQESGVLFYAFLCLWRKDFTYKFSLMIFF